VTRKPGVGLPRQTAGKRPTVPFDDRTVPVVLNPRVGDKAAKWIRKDARWYRRRAPNSAVTMAEIRRTADHSIWFTAKNYREQAGDPLLATLNALAGGEQIALLFDGVRGRWERFRKGALAIRPANHSAKSSWQATAQRIGDWFPLDLAPVGQPSAPGAAMLTSVSKFPSTRTAVLERPVDVTGEVVFTPTKSYQGDLVLCLGLDLAWWGGSSGDPDSQYDALTSVVPGDERGNPQFQRVTLSANPHPNQFAPNCDPDATAILGAIEKVIEQRPASKVVLAVDAPLIAAARSLPPRSKLATGGALARRQPENALAAAMAAGPAAWRQVCHIQPGAPLCPRVTALVGGLTSKCGFRLYDPDAPGMPDRLLIECFPSEAIWALGCLQHYGDITPDQACQYKSKNLKTRSQPWYVLAAAVHHNLAGFSPAIGLPAASVHRWILNAAATLLTDPRLLDEAKVDLLAGKLFDDVVDALNCLFTAVALSQNAAHIWRGTNADDGHIIGPGR